MIEEWSQLVYELFVRDIFGSPILFGGFILFMFGAFAFKMRMPFDAFAVVFVTLLIFLAGFNTLSGFPNWIVPIVIMVLGLIIGFAVLKIGRR